LLTRQPIRCGQGEHEHGEEDMHVHRPRSCLGRMLQTPLLLALLDTTILTFPRISWSRV
jgi:hypothetical protein